MALRLLLPLLVSVVSKAQEPVIRVNVDLVQVEVVVTDGAGDHVAGLEAADFEILENGKAQPIANFSFIRAKGPGVSDAPSIPPLSPAPPVKPAPIVAVQAGRTVAVIVDDLGMGEQSFARLRRPLERFVDEQVQPGDLAAIITTSGRLGALQQLTADRRVLRAAVAKLRSLPNHRMSILDDDFPCAWYKTAQAGPAVQRDQDVAETACCPQCPLSTDPCWELQNDRRSRYYGLLSIAAFRRVVDGLRELPGRRSILLFTEGMPLVRAQGLGETNRQLIDAFEAFVAHANRSSIAVNTVDPRGLAPPFQDECAAARQAELQLTQSLLIDLARRTAGLSFIDQNDLAGPLTRIMTDQDGYYLIGYKAPASPESRRTAAGRFRKIGVRLRPPGLRARFHSDIYEEPAPVTDRAHRLAAAILSPFSSQDVRIRLCSRFWDSSPAPSVLDTVLQVDAHDLVFSTGEDGRRKAEFDILAVIYGSESKPLNTFERTYTVSLTAAAYERALTEGLVQRLQMAPKDAGAFQIRAAVRDRQSGRIGSASEFVDLPDLSRGVLALSGIALSARDLQEQPNEGTAGRLRYRSGERVFYTYQVLNPRADRSGTVRLEVRTALYRDGAVLGSSSSSVTRTSNPAAPRRIVVSNDFRLGEGLRPGDYTLQVTAVDKNASPNRSVATQSIDLEVID